MIEAAAGIVGRNWPMILGSGLYLGQAIISYRAENYGIALALLFYCCANVGLIIANEGH